MDRAAAAAPAAAACGGYERQAAATLVVLGVAYAAYARAWKSLARAAARAESEQLAKKPREFTRAQLRRYDGSSAWRPLLLAIADVLRNNSSHPSPGVSRSLGVCDRFVFAVS